MWRFTTYQCTRNHVKHNCSLLSQKQKSEFLCVFFSIYTCALIYFSCGLNQNIYSWPQFKGNSQQPFWDIKSSILNYFFPLFNLSLYYLFFFFFFKDVTHFVRVLIAYIHFSPIRNIYKCQTVPPPPPATQNSRFYDSNFVDP